MFSLHPGTRLGCQPPSPVRNELDRAALAVHSTMLEPGAYGCTYGISCAWLGILCPPKKNDGNPAVGMKHLAESSHSCCSAN